MVIFFIHHTHILQTQKLVFKINPFFILDFELDLQLVIVIVIEASHTQQVFVVHMFLSIFLMLFVEILRMCFSHMQVQFLLVFIDHERFIKIVLLFTKMMTGSKMFFQTLVVSIIDISKGFE